MSVQIQKKRPQKRMQVWQIAILVGGGGITGCLVCIAFGLMISSIDFLGTPTPQALLDVPVTPTTASITTTEIVLVQSTGLPTETMIPSPTSTQNVIPPSITPVLPSLASCIPSNERQRAQVVKVIDGDTIEVALNERNIAVRYIGIDTPEYYETFGLQASAANQALVEGKVVTLIRDKSETDKYGRLLRYVLIGEVFVNYELVRQGLAFAREYPPDTACHTWFSAAMDEARNKEIGLWSLKDVSRANSTEVPVNLQPTSLPASAPCNCSGPDLDCADFPTRASAQSCFNYCRSQGFGDIFRLDADSDLKVCETKNP